MNLRKWYQRMKKRQPKKITFSAAPWCNLSNGQQIWGIKARLPNSTKWAFCIEGSEPLLFETEAEAHQKIVQLEGKSTTDGEDSK